MTVYNNMAYGLRNRKTPKAEIERLVHEAAKMLELDHLLDRKPGQLLADNVNVSPWDAQLCVNQRCSCLTSLCLT